MDMIADAIDRQLLDNYQRDFPIVPRPFAVLGAALDTTESDVITRFTRMQACSRITRVGATCAPNTISASTLAAVAAPPEQVEEIAALIDAEPGVNHNYLREDLWNLWFVVTGPDRAHVDATLARIETTTGLRVLALRLVRPFNVDLGFRMTNAASAQQPLRTRNVKPDVLQDGDRELMQELVRGLPLVPEPYAVLAEKLCRNSDDLLARIAILQDAGILSRLGVIVRHRALGWRSNAMVVWDLDSHTIDTVGPLLATQPGITLCYERTPVADVWPYRLYSMIHARSRKEAMAHLRRAAALPALRDVPHKALFSTRCFKQTGALLSAKPERAA